MGHIRTIGLGTMTGAISSAVSLVAGIITVPLLIDALGIEGYGVLGIVSSLVGFVGFADLGLTSTITNAVSYAYAKQDRGEISRLISGGLMLYTPVIVGIIGLVAILVYAPWFSLATALKIEPELVGFVRIIIVLMLGYTMAGAFWGGVLKSLYHGVNEVVVYNTIQTVYNTLFAVAFILYLLFGDVSLKGVVLMQAGGSVVRLALFYVVAKIRYRWFHFQVTRESFRAVRPLLNYSAVLLISSVCIVILERSDNLVLTHYLGPAAVAMYGIAYKLFYLPAAMLPIATASVPAVATAYAAKDFPLLATLYHQILRVNILLKFIVFAFLAVFAKDLVALWVHKPVFAGYTTIAAIGVTYILFAWNGTYSLFFGAMQKFEVELKANVVSIILNVAISVYLVQKIGMPGVAVGTACSLLLVNAWYMPRKLAQVLDIHPLREAVRLLTRMIPLLGALIGARYLLITVVPAGMWFYTGAFLIGVAFTGAAFIVAFGRGEQQFIRVLLQEKVLARFTRLGTRS